MIARVRLWVVLAVALCAVGHVSAGTVVNGSGGALVEYIPNGVAIRDGAGGTSFPARSWSQSGGRALTVVDSGAPLRLGGHDLTISATRTLTAPAINKAAALAARGLPYVGTGILIWDLFDAVRVRPDEAGGLVKDPTQNPNGDESSPYYLNTGVPSGWGRIGTATTHHPSLIAACEAVVPPAPFPNHGAWQRRTGTVTGTYPNQQISCQWRSYATNDPNCNISCGMAATSGAYGGTDVIPGACPQSIDPLDPAWTVPAGEPPGPDGKCRTARHNWQSITPQAAAELLEATKPATTAQLEQMAKDAIAAGEGIEASDRQLSGPTTKTGQPTTTTTTNPDGSTTTATKTAKTTYNYSTVNNVTYNTSVVTVTTNGTTTTTTETTTPGGERDPDDPCAKNPDMVGCATLGSATDAVQWQSVNVPFAAEDLGFGGACPANVTWHVFGMDLQWSYARICAVAPDIRVALLLMASIAAIGIVFKETSA